jgi:HD-like signal output (HDOD) protein
MDKSLLSQVLESPLSDLPEVVVDLLDVCDRPEASVAEVAAATILDATAVDGLDLVRAIAVGAAIASKFSSHNPVTVLVRGRCLLAAGAARALTRDEGRRASD